MIPEQTTFIWKMYTHGDRAGFPLLWMHGFMGSGNDWQGFVESHFSDYFNILIDLPGHGQSHLSEKASYTEILDALVQQLTAQSITKFIPIGYSMGGRIAFHLQQRYPESIPALVGLSTAPGLKTKIERSNRQSADHRLMEKLSRVGFSRFLQEWYELPLFSSINTNAELMKELKSVRGNNTQSQLNHSLQRFGNGALPSLWEKLGEIAIPVLLLGGSLDKKYTGINQEMCGLLPESQHELIENADHAFHLEKPLESAQIIRHFLSETI